MKKVALVFLLAIFAPALLLGVLALRTASRQRLIMEQQEVELRQKETDELAEKTRSLLADEQRNFLDAVDRLAARMTPGDLARNFSTRLAGEWNRRAIGFAVDRNGLIVSPRREDVGAERFLRENNAFLGNEAAAEVYQSNTRNGVARNMNEQDLATLAASPELSKDADASAGVSSDTHLHAAAQEQAGADRSTAKKAAPEVSGSLKAGRAALDSASTLNSKLRAVIPQKQISLQAPQVSLLNSATSRFRQLVADGHDGVLARFVDDELVVIFWVRPAGGEPYILGAQMAATDLFQAIRPGLEPFTSREACLAILDDRARPVALSVPGFAGSWKNPFVATEIGESLPHWEAALYLLRPGALSESARLITLTLYGLVGLAIGAIGWGSFLIGADTRRQLNLAQKKTDFVSNVSHELKTPLTSIRMFAELLQEHRVSDPGKVDHYLKIIRLEAERLTRLINNVLDFARLERNQPAGHQRVIDLHPELKRLWQSQAEHLRAQGFQTAESIAIGPFLALADPDAIAQVIVNLLSNAEKYSLERKEVELHAFVREGVISISILDRGVGVPPGEEKKIFESFYRAHDSLSSGIPGSGLGLTLATRIAEDHGGSIHSERRPGGGSIFTFRIPEHPAGS